MAYSSATRIGWLQGNSTVAGASLMRVVLAATCARNTAGRAAKQTKMVLRHPDRVEAECLGQERLGQHFTEKLLRVPASRPVGWGGISEGEVTELHARTLLSGGMDGERAWTQGLAHLQSHLDETPFQRVRELLDQRQTFTVPERCDISHTQEPSDTEIDDRRRHRAWPHSGHAQAHA